MLVVGLFILSHASWSPVVVADDHGSARLRRDHAAAYRYPAAGPGFGGKLRRLANAHPGAIYCMS